MGCCSSNPQAGVKARGKKPKTKAPEAVYNNDHQWGPENYGDQQDEFDDFAPLDINNYDQMGPDDGYPPENYPNYDPYQPENVADGSLLSSQSSNAVNSDGPRKKKILKKKVRIDDTQGTLPMVDRNSPEKDFNGLLSPDEYSPERSPPRERKPVRKSHKKFAPKKGQVWLWNVRDVRHWIENLGDAYREYVVEFEDNAIDGPLLLRMDNNDYHELGVVSPLHVKKIQVELDRLVQQHKKGPTVPEDVILTRSQMTDSVIRKKKKKKKRPKKTGMMAFPSQYSMFPQPGLPPSLTSSVTRHRTHMGHLTPQMYMQHAMPPMSMATPYGYQLFVPTGPIYE